MSKIRSLSSSVRNIMRAIQVAQFGGPDVLKVEKELPIPEAHDDQVLVKVEAAGVNPVDTYIRSGTYARKPDLPYIPGSDGAGVVHKVGPNVTKVKEGDRVYLTKSDSGSYAEYAIVHESSVGHIPQTMTYEEAAGIGTPYYTAYRALVLRGKADKGQTVLIHGASGGVGTACIQIGKYLGLKVIGTAGSQSGIELVTKHGADLVFNHRQDGYIQKIQDAVGTSGIDLIIEMLANVNLQHDLDLIKFHGTIVNVGSRGPIEITPRSTMAKECIVTGVLLPGSTPGEWLQTNTFLSEGLSAGWIKPCVGKSYHLEQASQAHEEIIATTSAQGKMVLKL